MLRDSYDLPDVASLSVLAKHLTPRLTKGTVVALHGTLGAGKTEFARALLHELGYQGDVPSPTFTILQTYNIGSLHIAHFDLYRLKSAAELDELGWDDALADGVTLVEWPERAERRIPKNAIKLRFFIEPNGARRCAVET